MNEPVFASKQINLLTNYYKLSIFKVTTIQTLTWHFESVIIIIIF